MKRALTGILASALVLGTLTPAGLAGTSAFVDVPANAPFAGAVADLTFRGIINGADATHYQPDRTLTRAEFAKVFARLVGLASVSPAQPSFGDVGASHWAFGYIEALNQAGIETGVGNGQFNPDGNVTREQAAKMMVIALGQQGRLDPAATLSFADAASVDTWAVPYVALAAQLKLVGAQSGNTFAGTAELTRGDAAIWGENVLGFARNASGVATVGGFQATVFAQGTDLRTKPDDITTLGGHLFVTYQNGVGPSGEVAKSGRTFSTVIEYSAAGQIVNRWHLTGRCDGLTADPANNRVLATVNEDANSSLYIITPGAAAEQQLQHITYKVDPTTMSATDPAAWGGGTDSIVISDGNIYLSASHPGADANGSFSHAALVQVMIQGNTATLKPVLMGNATATDVASGKPVTLALSDPDSNTVVPAGSGQYAGDLVLDDQGDNQLIFVHHVGAADQSVKRLTIGTQVDDVAWATSARGTLYVVDQGDNKLYAITGSFTPGTVFVASPNDAGVASYVGTVDLSTGTITPFAIGLKSPKGLLFVPQSAQ